MEHFDATTTLIIIAVIAYAIVKQFMAKPVRTFGFIVFPLLALYEACKDFPKLPVPEHQLIECAVMLALAFIAAAIQATNTEVFFKDNQLYTRGKLIAVLTWAGYFLVRIAMRYIWSDSTEWMTWLGMAVTFGTRSLFLYIKHPEIGKALLRRSSRRVR
ncbi:conserved membrane protein of unknown function [Ruminococcaceae bacterium BL-4]|nr:conserved membrane protein of unknown function [Ruminococcaceae bacterium BL-4]